MIINILQKRKKKKKSKVFMINIEKKIKQMKLINKQIKQ